MQQNTTKTFVEVGSNVEVVVIANASGSFALNVSDVPPTARGGAVILSQDGTQTVALTDGLQSGQGQFVFQRPRDFLRDNGHVGGLRLLDHRIEFGVGPGHAPSGRSHGGGRPDDRDNSRDHRGRGRIRVQLGRFLEHLAGLAVGWERRG